MRGRPSREPAERFALLIPDRPWADEPFRGEMLHQPEKEGQVGLAHTLFVEREDEEAALVWMK